MNVLIVEDENLAAARLVQLIGQYDPDIKIMTKLDTVRETVQWFADGNQADLAFFDIQLADGISFDIFEKCTVNCPVIFTTAYDEYALRAFKVKSIDYLLKPFSAEEVERAFRQYHQLADSFTKKETSNPHLDTIRQVMQMMEKSYKSRFMVKSGVHLASIPVEEVACFFSEQKIGWLKTLSNKKYAIDYTLEQLEKLLDPQLFFRLNRKFIVSIHAIGKVVAYSNSRLKIEFTAGPENEPVIVSRERVGAFKKWLDG